MIQMLLFVLAWMIVGALGFAIGTAIDHKFYPNQKPDWRYIFLGMALGPIQHLVFLRVLYDVWQRERKKRIPRNLQECFKALDRLLTGPEKEDAKRHGEYAIKNHHGLGQTIRNEWGLWSGSKLKDYFNGLGIHHADDMSGIILDSYHRYLNGMDLKLLDQVHSYIDYWGKENGQG